MVKSFKQYNESVRNLMTSRSEEEIRKSIANLTPEEKILKGIEHGIYWAVEEGVKEIDKDKKIQIPTFNLLRLVYNKDKEILELLVKNGFGLSKYDIVPTVVRVGDMEYAEYMLSLGVSPVVNLRLIRSIINETKPEEFEVLRFMISKDKKIQKTLRQGITRRSNKLKKELEDLEKYKNLL